jgi:ornithine decarboxylase
MENAAHNYIKNNTFERPTLVMSLENLESNYQNFKAGMPDCHVHYAVKANPHPAILYKLHSLGSRFDAASAGEIDMCLAAGAAPSEISFGNTVKRPQDIRYAYSKGVRLFAVDSIEEAEKVAKDAPGSNVFVRVLVQSTEAEWPLSRKFGCSSSMVLPVMEAARDLGLIPVGLSFHVGSQTRHPHMWFDTLDFVESIWMYCREEGFDLWLLNAGGGFPSYYGVDITDSVTYCAILDKEIRDRFVGLTYLMIEPGRGMVANLGSIAAEVLLVSTKTPGDPVRWLYLNIGRFSGLAETEQEAIKYRFFIPGKDNDEKSEYIVAGPTCDSADVLYETHKVLLSKNIQCGDKIIIDNVGAYTTTYSTVAFNGFPPLEVIVI